MTNEHLLVRQIVERLQHQHPEHQDGIERLPAGAAFLELPGVSTTASMSARKLSHRTRRSMASSGSPIAEQGFQALIPSP